MDAIKTAQEHSMSCGERIRRLRLRQALTLQVLAEKAGISVGFLSQVERDRATPSLGTLAAIAGALGENVDYFISTPTPSEAVTRADRRERFAVGKDSLSYEMLSANVPGGIMTSLIIHVPPKFQSEKASYKGEELVLVLEGRINLRLEETQLELTTGDSLHFMGETPHSFENPDDTPLRLMWTGTASPFSAYPALRDG